MFSPLAFSLCSRPLSSSIWLILKSCWEILVQCSTAEELGMSPVLPKVKVEAESRNAVDITQCSLWSSWLLCAVTKIGTEDWGKKNKVLRPCPSFHLSSWGKEKDCLPRDRRQCSEEEQYHLLCNYIAVLIPAATFSVTRFPRYQANFIGIISFHGVTSSIAYEIQLTADTVPQQGLRCQYAHCH